ncbi:MAG: sulfur carrier protein ThiS [Actinomycetota bacterium]
MTGIVANGTPRDVTAGATIADLLAEYGWRPEWVVVEYNGEPLERARYARVTLRSGDRLEIVRAVAGG